MLRSSVRLRPLALVAAAACSTAVEHPRYVAQPSSALTEVTAPPPPGRVEVLPRRPRRGAVWIDGEWTWRRERWAWLPGRWVDPPAQARFSPWAFVRGADGRLWYAPGVWRDGRGAVLAAPPPVAAARVEATAVVDANGVVETTGPVLAPGTRVSLDGGA